MASCITGGILYTVPGMFNPVGMILVALSAAAASFGGTSGMAWMTQCLGGKFAPKTASQPAALQRSPGGLIPAVITAMIFVGLLGPGGGFPQATVWRPGGGGRTARVWAHV